MEGFNWKKSPKYLLIKTKCFIVQALKSLWQLEWFYGHSVGGNGNNSKHATKTPIKGPKDVLYARFGSAETAIKEPSLKIKWTGEDSKKLLFFNGQPESDSVVDSVNGAPLMFWIWLLEDGEGDERNGFFLCPVILDTSGAIAPDAAVPCADHLWCLACDDAPGPGSMIIIFGFMQMKARLLLAPFEWLKILSIQTQRILHVLSFSFLLRLM